MKCTSEIVIDLTRARVVEIFDNPDNLKVWQPGATSKLFFDEKGRHIEMVETVTSRNLPDEFSGTYATQGVFNIVRNRFVEEGPGRTRSIADNKFQFGGFMKLVGFFMRGAFPKQTMAFMQQFKAFAEGRRAA